ncbi:MAG: hypothetical protein J2P46_00390 [Zavarzinella sp.]|nr:hypothetical protein [Zavarzinella sp.]
MLATLIGAVAGALWLVMHCIYKRARAARVSPIAAYLVALAGYMAGTATMVIAITLLLELLYPDGQENDWVAFVTFVLGSSLGAAVGAAAGYVYLWMRTTHDTDFEDYHRK